jgi:hypothetical protein
MILQAPLETATETIGQGVIDTAVGNPAFLVGGIILIIVGILILKFVKKIIVNSVLGAIAWAIAVYVFNIALPPIPSLLVSVVFGLPGIGVLLMLSFLGVI